jgi:hypothetical protein
VSSIDRVSFQGKAEAEEISRFKGVVDEKDVHY